MGSMDMKYGETWRLKRQDGWLHQEPALDYYRPHLGISATVQTVAVSKNTWNILNRTATNTVEFGIKYY